MLHSKFGGFQLKIHDTDWLSGQISESVPATYYSVSASGLLFIE